MKTFLWKKNKLNGTNGKKKPTSISTTHYMLHESCKQEFNDWPQALLHIGTLANSSAEDSFPFQKYTKEFKLEEVGKLQNELNMKLGDEQEENLNYLINEHLTSEHSSLEPEAQEVEAISDVSNIKHGNFYPGNSLIHSTGRDLCYDSKKGGIGKKSLSFLFKKMFACTKGFQPTPSFKDPLLSTDSRMEKILRAMLQKKIHPQGSSSTTFVKITWKRIKCPSLMKMMMIMMMMMMMLMKRKLRVLQTREVNGSRQILNILFWRSKWGFFSCANSVH